MTGWHTHHFQMHFKRRIVGFHFFHNSDSFGGRMSNKARFPVYGWVHGFRFQVKFCVWCIGDALRGWRNHEDFERGIWVGKTGLQKWMSQLPMHWFVVRKLLNYLSDWALLPYSRLAHAPENPSWKFERKDCRVSRPFHGHPFDGGAVDQRGVKDHRKWHTTIIGGFELHWLSRCNLPGIIFNWHIGFKGYDLSFWWWHAE